MSPDILLALSSFALVSSITPGPNNLMLMASGANFGFRRSLPHLLGVATGFTAMVLVVGAGVAQVFAAFPVVEVILKTACAVYLLYLAWKIANASAPAKDAPLRSVPLTFVQAALFQWVNPKAWTMAVTAVTVYAPTEHSTIALASIALVFGLINLPCVTLWTLAGVKLRSFLSNPRSLRLFNAAAALLLIATLAPVVL